MGGGGDAASVMGCDRFVYLPSPLYCFSSLLSFSSDVLSYTLVKFFDDKYVMLYSSRLIFKRGTLYLTHVDCVMMWNTLTQVEGGRWRFQRRNM
jgi:hypothetical protein